MKVISHPLQIVVSFRCIEFYFEEENHMLKNISDVFTLTLYIILSEYT